MTWKDKPEIGLKDVTGPELPASPGRLEDTPAVRETPAASPAGPKKHRVPGRPLRVVPVRTSPPKSTG